MNRKTILVITIFLIVQALVTGACCKLSAKGLKKDVETVFGWTNEECNEKVQNLQKLNVYCSNSRIIKISDNKDWFSFLEKYGYNLTETKPEFNYHYYTDDSLFAYRWEYKDSIIDYSTLYIDGKCYYFERVIK